MHDTETMALMPRDRLSPLLMPHHVTSIPYGLVQRKQYDGHTKHPMTEVFSVSFDDDDDFSDHDSHYSEDEIDTMPLPICHVTQLTSPDDQDVTQRLLNFVDMANSDIQKFFGRRKGEEDSCDIYEEKWTSGKSGRELYYADLLKIAQGGDTDRPRKSGKSSTGQASGEKEAFSGHMDRHAGLGPLGELFEYGLRNVHLESSTKNGRNSAKRLKTDQSKNNNSLPMAHRKLPESFWKEPKTNFAVGPTTQVSMAGSLQANKAPDFSDLLHHWTGGVSETGEFHAELSSSEMSMTSTDST
ncbi:protein PERCC1-like [Liolophura sinensis]|uniref:protein PERCC1-like n=1 Tax=Liolophura sinensis TaxID=3198878 RepID=UPI0031595F43